VRRIGDGLVHPRSDAVDQGSVTPAQAYADDADLVASLDSLARLVEDHFDLAGLLGQVATISARAIPGADGAGVTLLRVDGAHSRVEALAASHPFVTEIDEIQYEVVKEGPCITAALERRTVRSGSLETEAMWPRFGPCAARLGIHSALSLPLLLPGQVVGAINAYACAADVFDEHAAELGELFAAPAAVSVHNAQLLAHARTLTTQLETAISGRSVIDQAVGLLRGRTGCSAEEALTRLRATSQREHTKLVDIAQHILDDAVRRARRRHHKASPAGDH
jgi:GAF domain-containing protein